MDNPGSKIEIQTIVTHIFGCQMEKELRRSGGGFRLCSNGEEVLLFMGDTDRTYREWTLIPIYYFQALLEDIPGILELLRWSRKGKD